MPCREILFKFESINFLHNIRNNLIYRNGLCLRTTNGRRYADVGGRLPSLKKGFIIVTISRFGHDFSSATNSNSRSSCNQSSQEKTKYNCQ